MEIIMKFRISDKVFTIGSCFARNIRKHLNEKGITTFPQGEVNNFLTYYNTFSILYEFFPINNREIDVFQNSNGEWQDPTRSVVLSSTKESVVALSRKITNEMQAFIKQSDVFIITLGMSECFMSSNYMWSTHPQSGLKRGIRSGGTGKCIFYNATMKDNYNNLLKVVHSLQHAKVFFTVSPVPLKRTFVNGLDNKTANAISKDKLRDAAQMLAANYDNVEYYDSFEYCYRLNKKENIYMPDGRHVKPFIVKQVVDRFLERHYEEN